jgi:glycosyltransferase involved in cell wall biosynthesis
MSTAYKSSIENDSKLLSIVLPLYNEEGNIDYLFERLLSSLNKLQLKYEIICINDGSTDGTLEKILDYHHEWPEVKIINFSRNFGKEFAVTAGLKYSRGNAVIPIDADLQDPPELIEDLINEWSKGYDIVYAVRKKRHGDNLFKRFTAYLFYKIINFLSETPIPKNTGDFRLLDQKVVNVLNNLPERTRFMKGLFAWTGFKQGSIIYDRPSRRLGKTKWNMWKLWNFALDGITLFSTSPLRFWSYIGLSISLLSFVYGFILIIRTLIYGKDVPGYASIMVAILFLGGLQLISLGILGEYLGRVYAEVKQRPLYIINKTYGFEEEKEQNKAHGENDLLENRKL